MIEAILSWIANVSHLVIPALGESLWLGLLLAFSAATLLNLFRFNARSRHVLWLLILMAICAIPLIVSGSFGFSAEKNVSLAAYKVDSIEEPESPIQIPLTVAAGILATILLISLFRLVLLARAFKELALFRRESTAAPQWLEYLLNRCLSNANIKRKIQIRLSTRIQAPALAGFFKPVVLFPAKLLTCLHSEEIQQVLLHEIAHLKRHDDWAILIQKFLSAIFFFNPAVVWISKRMDLEREIACDDSVVEAGGTPQSYALCLTRLAEFSQPLADTPLLSASSQLSRRVDMLLNRSKKNSGMSTLSTIVILLLISGVVIWVSNSNPLLAVANPDQKSKIDQAHATDRKVVQVNAEGFESASERMEQAQRKMEEARDEMLQAAEAMRHAGEVEDCAAEVMLGEEYDHDSDTDHEAVVIRSEKVLRKVERDIQRKQYRKRIVPGHAEIQPLPPLEPLPPNEAPVPEIPEAPEVPMPEIWATQEPSEPEVVAEPQFDIDFEADPMPEPEPELREY